jgi:hypothetical protein
MTDPVTIGYGANKWIKDVNTKVVTLTWIAYSGSGWKSLLDSEDGLYYTVPAGKKLTLLKAYGAYSSSSAGGFFKTIATATANSGSLSGTGARNLTSIGYNVAPNDIYMEIPAGLKINVEFGGTGYTVTIVGVETNA